MLQSLGVDALTGMISHVFFIIITWRVLQGVRIEPIIKKGQLFEARVLFVFVTIMIGTSVSRFFLEFLNWSQDLIYLF
ncbi:putative integral membrane protein (TIGR02327 family) [Salirhabdus euzebyi]|uniref:Putative integral membrane protein (TIGR02327 family) n=1 Tax=Salirhabdus euzebyi TaxID=394506 RepID=A0A841Q6D8_9BACI|nr:DUF1146 family protein [Salirhabdus euzebyi]MBB6453976.1 putative integral membrane protein (TIGR02327 family) [Salirhabdus euzebyi]